MLVEFQSEIRFFRIGEEIDRHDLHRVRVVVGGHHGPADPRLRGQAEGDDAELITGRYVAAVGFDPLENELGEPAMLGAEPTGGFGDGHRQAADHAEGIALDQGAQC